MVKALIRAVVLAGVILGFATGGYAAPALTLTTFSGVASDGIDVDAQFGRCRVGGEIIVVYFRDPGVGGSFAYFMSATGRAVFGYWPIDTASGPPTEIAVAVVDPAANDTIPALAWKPYDEAQHGEGPCPLLFPPAGV